MDTILQDVRFALRSARRSPGFVTATVLTIALGIGATTAVFTVVERVVLRPLPFPDSERAWMVCETNPRVGDWCPASPANAADWAQSVPALETIGVARSESTLVTHGGRSFGINGGIATPGFFRALGVRPALGRLFDEADLDPSRNQVAVLTHAFWRDELQGRPEAIGEVITLEGGPFRIIGVLPPDVYIPEFDFAKVWRPITTSVDDTSKREWRGFIAVGKLAAGATPDELRGQLGVVHDRLAKAYPAANAAWGIRIQSVREFVAGSISATLWLFLAAVTLVLVIACVNVANLLLVRASTRTPEFAVRAALGAGRLRVVRQLLTESLLLATAGGAAGWLLAAGAIRMLVAVAPSDIPRLAEVQIDARIAVFTIGLTVLTSLLFGLAPARAAARFDTSEALKAGRQVGRGREGTRSLLVVAELVLSVMLLVAAGLLTRAFSRLAAWDPGFDRSGVSVAWLLAPVTNGTTTASAVARLEQIREQVAAIPGLQSVGLGSAGPVFGGTETDSLSQGDASPPVVVNWFDIDSHYFRALGRRIVRGRDVSDGDVNGAPPVAVVNEAFVRRVFPDRDPIGQQVTLQSHPAQIVGVVSDVRPTRPDRTTPPEIFWPIRQYPRLAAYLVLRTGTDVPGLERAIRDRVAAADPAVQVNALTPIERSFQRSLISPRFNMLLIGAFAVVAILLAAVGVYGVLAYSVASRTREIGLRIALGASSERLVRDVVRRALSLATAGAAIGLGGALLFGRVLSGWLYGVPVSDPLVIVTVTGGVLVIALIASGVPAWRASRVDPLVALRPE